MQMQMQAQQKAQEEAQAKASQQAQQQEQQNSQQSMESANARPFEQTRGRSPQGNPPAQSVPGQGREQITGETMGEG